MALATTCPSCNTSFKVLPDQLKLRRGAVRCGVCQHVFSGLDHLRYIPDGAKANAAGTPIPASVAARIAKDADEPNAPAVTEEDLKTAMFMPETVFAPTTQVDPNPGTSVPTNIPASIQAQGASTSPPPVSIEDLLHEKAIGDAAIMRAPAPSVDETDAIDYFGQGKRTRGFTGRGWLLQSMVLALLLLVFIVQMIIGFRDKIVARNPASKPALLALIQPLGLEIKPPRSIEALTIESFELRASPDPDVFSVSALLRNQRPHSVQWPAMELTLTNGQGAMIVRRVFQANEYLSFLGGDLQAGVSARAEVPVRLALQASNLTPTGYSVSLFYPIEPR
jgi:predicted Zn finger-like uncharacterized protein